MKKAILLSALCAIAFSSCQEEDFGVNEQTMFKQAYDKNFKAKYGDINPDQDWDISTRSSASEYVPIAQNDYYEIPSGIIDWFHENLPDEQPNNTKITPFTLITTEETTFEILPIYQGNTSYPWTVSMVIDDVETPLWVKGDYPFEYFSNNRWQQFTASVGSTGNAGQQTKLHAKSNVYTVPAGKIISFQITNYNYKENRGDEGTTKINKSNTTPAYVGYLKDCPLPENLDAAYDASIVAFEGKDYDDGDFNDAAFLLISYSLPPVIYNDEEVTIVENQKRFMVEDCGSSVDWDFNDVVVDTWSEHKLVYTYGSDGSMSIKEDYGAKVYAKLAHLCGTFPFKVCFGNDNPAPAFIVTDPTDKGQTLTELADEDHTGTYHIASKVKIDGGWEPDFVKEITDDATNPEIVVYSYKNFDLNTPVTADGVYTSKPTKGDVPTVLCTKLTDQWTEENQDVAEASWWSAFGM